jgi:hypothetical protein
MKSVAEWLREGDPIAGERDLSDVDARRIRQVVLAHREPDRAGVLWRGVAVLASIALVVGALGTWLRDARGAGAPARSAGPGVVTPLEPPPRQVQFVTPRGTRVVWVLQADTAQEGTR